MSHTRVLLSHPTESLRQDHRKISGLLREYFSVPPEDRSRRGGIFDQIHREILLHFTLEEEILYPAIQKTGVERAVESIEEARWGHRLLRRLLTDLSQMESDREAFDAKVALLKTNFEHYSDSEERGLFPEVRDMTREFRESLRSRLEGVRERLLEGEQFES